MHNSGVALDIIANHDSFGTHPSAHTINTVVPFPGVKSEVEQMEMTTQFQQIPRLRTLPSPPPYVCSCANTENHQLSKSSLENGNNLFSLSRISDLDTIRLYFKARSDKKGKWELERKIPSSFLQYFQVSHCEASNDTTIVNTGRKMEDRCGGTTFIRGKIRLPP